jgi:hypothetical protein
MTTLNEVLELLEALPLVALPPVVLPQTHALPVLACWFVLLLTSTSLLLVT